ncbi:MAG: Bug family tripartite tricarboxylate transporter substrate binding protein [Burkholderiales bacterium]
MKAVHPVARAHVPAGPRRRTLGAIGAAAACALVPGAAGAQGFPSRPIRMVCPLPPGSPSDVLARPLAQRVSIAWGQPVVVDNRPGATGAIGLDAVAKAAPDGHTVGILFMTHTVLPTLFGKLPYDTERDIVPVSNLVWLYNVLVVPEASPIRSVQDLMRVAREQPGKLNYASGGNGSPAHMVAEFFKQRADLRIVHVPFKGPADAVQGLMGAQVDLMFATTSAAVPQVRAGRLRPLVVTSPQRLAALPDVPTMAEAGVTGWDVREWQGVAAPAGTPPELGARWFAELARAMADPGVRERLAALGMDVAAPNSPQAFAGLVKGELGRWSAMVKTLGLRVD